ncbi:MAG TPA: reverse transcriptase/maturase family protein [Candidatus Paceibacterota bacterium]
MSVPTFEEIISLENLLLAWKEFVVGKKSRKDVQVFQQHLMENIISLHTDLVEKRYKHSDYEAFNISDPKPRNIHKASVRDRLLHHALYRVLYPYFDKRFTSDSYSCRLDRGTHKALETFQKFSYKVSKNRTKQIWILKCDVRKFFASIDHAVLMKILTGYITGRNTLWLLSEIVSSFSSTRKNFGLPLGNLTSQLLVNIYMNEFDQYMKHRIKAKYYIRYADDFVILSHDKKELESILLQIGDFLLTRLKLQLHPDKIFIRTLASGVDFLGWVNFHDHKVLRTITKRRMLRSVKDESRIEVVQSYRGLLSHGNARKLINKISK